MKKKNPNVLISYVSIKITVGRRNLSVHWIAFYIVSMQRLARRVVFISKEMVSERSFGFAIHSRNPYG